MKKRVAFRWSIVAQEYKNRGVPNHLDTPPVNIKFKITFLYKP